MGTSLWNIGFEITESADFLAPSENTKTFDTFPAEQSNYILPLRFDDDQTHEIHGTVTVTLTKDTSDPPQYMVNAHGEGRSATAQVKDDELPFLMVRPVSDAVIEGSPVEFELYTNSIRDESFMVSLSLSGNLNFLQALPSPTELAGEYNTGEEFILTIDTIDNDLPGGRGTINVTLLPGDNYLIDTLDRDSYTATAVIVDNDTEIDPIISIRAEQPFVATGEKVVFLVSAVPAPANRFMLDVNIEPSNERLILWRVPTKVEIIDGKGQLKFSTTEDSEGGTISVSVMNDSQFEFLRSTANVRILSPSPAPAPVDPESPSISVASVVANAILNMDNEQESENSQQIQLNEQQLPEISIATVTHSVEEGQTVQFQISSSRQLNSTLSIQVAINSIGNSVPEHYNTTVLLSTNNSNAVVKVSTYDDNFAEESDIVTAEVIENESYSISEPKFAMATVLDTYDQLVRRDQIETANQQVIPAYMNAIGTSTNTATNEHLDLAFSDSLQSNFNLGGENTMEGLVTASGHAINEDSLSIRSVLGESSFILGLSSPQYGYNIGSVWGLGDQVDIFEENADESLRINGDLFVGHFGADAKLSQESLAGLQISISESELTYQEMDQDDINYLINTNLVSSYYGWSSAEYGLELRAIGGYRMTEKMLF